MSYKRKSNKFKAKKVKIDGITFDSKKESEHYLVLKDLLTKGKITDLVIKPVFQLRGYNGTVVCKMIPDFQFKQAGKTIINEVKSPITITPVYRLKKKLFLDAYPKVEFVEIM